MKKKKQLRIETCLKTEHNALTSDKDKIIRKSRIVNKDKNVNKSSFNQNKNRIVSRISKRHVKNRNNNFLKTKKFSLNYLFLIFIAALFMSIGYAEISDVNLAIAGSIEGIPQDGVYIIDMALKSNNNANVESSKINYYYGTMADTKVVLNQNTESSITYDITVYNSTNVDYIFIDTITDVLEDSFYSNEEIGFTVEGIESYTTTIGPKEKMTFSITFQFKDGADINKNELESKINFRFRIKPRITLTNEGQIYTIKNVYPDYTSEIYEFKVLNYEDNNTNYVGMKYNFETTLPKPFLLKIYDSEGNEVIDDISLVGNGVDKVDQNYTFKIVWDNTNPEDQKLYNDFEYLGKNIEFEVKLVAKPDDETYLDYSITKKFNGNLNTTMFYFETELEDDVIQYDNEEASTSVTIKNNVDDLFNLFNVKYKIKFLNNDKFDIYINNELLTNNEFVSEIIGNELRNDNVQIKFVRKDESDFNSVEEYIDVEIESIMPYAKKQEYKITLIRDLGINPKMTSEMRPIKYVDGEWVDADLTVPEDWFDYREQRWANVETENGYFVYIPRFAYKITSGYHTSLSTAGNISIVFLNKDNTLKTNYDSAGNYVTQDDLVTASKVDSYTSNSGINSTTKYIIHPAFTSFDSSSGNIDGIWIAKYEMSMEKTSDNGATWNSAVISSSTEGNVLISSDSTRRMVSKPGVSSWRYIEVSKIFENTFNMDRDNESHMTKNTEWGAATYLGFSNYGKGPIVEVEGNKSTSFITGCGANGSLSAGAASTTGNMYGIFDMAGGSYEYVAGYLNDICVGSIWGELYDINESLLLADSRYKDVYEIRTFSDGSTSNLYGDVVIQNRLKVGDALWEVTGDSSTTAWFGDEFYYAGSINGGHYPIFDRGGYYGWAGTTVGTTYTGRNTGENHHQVSFRTTLCIN